MSGIPSESPSIALYSSLLTFTTLFSLAYENVPADYGLLQIITNPQEQAGGDTLFASGYEAYERLSPTFRQMLEGMEVVKIQVYLPCISSHSV